MSNQTDNRILEQQDREQWREKLAAPHNEEQNRRLTKTFVFRCGGEWFGIEPAAVVSVAPMPPVHSVPHRSDNLAGVVNLHGTVTLCFALEKVMQCAVGPTPKHHMLLAMQHDGWLITCRVDEVVGMVMFDAAELKAPPATLSGTASGRIKGLFSFEQHSIACLQVEALFNAFKEAAH